jgi:hypothetical protein
VTRSGWARTVASPSSLPAGRRSAGGAGDRQEAQRVTGLQRSFPTEIYVGLALVILLALACDLLLVLTRRLATPWLARQRITGRTGPARIAMVVRR